MEKAQILQMSREEYRNRRDEREIAALGVASRIGMYVGGFICVALVFCSHYLFQDPIVGLVGWLVYFSMAGSANIVLYKLLGNQQHCSWAIIELTGALTFISLILSKVW